MSGIEGMSWCRRFDRAIDSRLVREDRPPCIEEHNGCGNCPECGYRDVRGGESGRPSPVMWARVDRGLYPEIEKAIGEWFPGDERVRAAAVAAWDVVMHRVPDRAPGGRGDLEGLYAALSRVLNEEEETKDQGDAWQKGYQAGIAYCRGRVAGMIESNRSE